MFISFFDMDIIVSPANIQFGVYVSSSQIGDEVRYEGEWVLVADHDVIDPPIILHQA